MSFHSRRFSKAPDSPVQPEAPVPDRRSRYRTRPDAPNDAPRSTEAPTIECAPAALVGRCSAWQLPLDETCASVSRNLLKRALTELRLSDDLADDALLMVSEISTNAWQHGLAPERRLDGSARPNPCPLELWAYTRVRPKSQLVVKVFDPWPEWNSPNSRQSGSQDIEAEHGRGLKLVDELSAQWGRHRSRSRLAVRPTHGKAVYFAVPFGQLAAQPARPYLSVEHAAHALRDQLSARGIGGLRLEHGGSRSVVSLHCGFTVWSENPGVFRWQDRGGRYLYRPFIDLVDVVEVSVRRHEELTAAQHQAR